MKNYNKLSCYLQDAIVNENERIDEGLSEFMKKMFGGFGFIGGLLSGKDKKDKMSEAMAKIMDKEMKDEERRMKDELDAEENLEIAKMEAEAEANGKRLDAVSKRKCDALNAKKRKLDNLKANIKNGNLLPTKEQTTALIDEINNADKDLTLDDDSPLKQLKDTAMMVMVNPDGSLRDPQTIKDLMAKKESDLTDEDKKLKKNIEEYNTLAKKHQKPILDGMESPAFKEDYMKSIFETARVGEELKNNDAKLKAEEDAYKKNCESQKTFDEFKQKHDDAKKAKKEADDKVSSLKDKNPFIKDNFNNDGSVSAMSTDDNKFQDAIQSVVTESVNAGKSEDDIKAELVKLGISEETAKKIAGKTVTHGDSGVEIPNNDYANVLFDDVTDDELTEAAKNVAEKQTSELRGAISVAETAKSQLDKNPDPSTPKGMQDIKANSENASKLESLSNYEAISEEDRTSKKYDPSSDAGKAEAKRLETERKNLDAQIKENENKQATRKQQREQAENRIEGRKENSIPAGIDKNEIESALDGLEAGEIKKDGKIGIMVGKEFIEKPKPGSSKEDEDKYIAKREKNVLEMDVDAKTDIKTVKPDPNNKGKYIIVKVDKDGKETEETGVDKEKATEAIISKRQKSLQSALVLKQKQDLKDNIGKVLKNGAFDKKAFDALSDAQKAAIIDIVNEPKTLDLYFDGTGEDLKDIKADLENNADKYSDDMGDQDDILDQFEDNKAEDGANDDDIETDEEEDVEDNEKTEDTLEDGTKLKKAEDGKWYKEDDLNNDGSPKDNAEAVDHKAMKKTKKKLENPAKIWRKKKKKNGGSTKSYYNGEKDKNGNPISISAKDYKAKVEAYKKEKKRLTESSKYFSLKNWLFEKLK